MGFLRERVDKDGKTHYIALYRDLRNRQRSAGTFTSDKEANKAWQRAESRQADGRVGDPARGRMRFERYVEDKWLPNHVMELSTRQSYTYALYKHIMPEFGPMKMAEIMPEIVREWITSLLDQGVSPATIKYAKDILSAIFTTAFNDQVTFIHPCRGVKTPPIPKKPRVIVTPEQFDMIYQALPDADAQLLVETDIESGLRWGELTELRVADLNFTTHIVTISRAVVELAEKFRPNGQRFVVKDYPKDKEYRQFKLSTQIVNKLAAHRDAEHLGAHDLLFAMRHEETTKTRPKAVPDPDTLGLTEPNNKGKRFKHGTLSGYGPGQCRCDHCRAACAIYRAKRRAEGKDNPRQPRTVATDTDRHIPAHWFRDHAWKPALTTTKLDIPFVLHGLRHAHASWLLSGGADLQIVKERLGHASIATTEKYLHLLPNADETALDALTKIRQRTAR